MRYLQRLEREFTAARDRDRLALMLAAYNMGIAHVQDAQALARRFGYDPLRWDGAMDVMVSLLEEPQVLRPPAGRVRAGPRGGRLRRPRAAPLRRVPARPPGRAAGRVATRW